MKNSVNFSLLLTASKCKTGNIKGCCLKRQRSRKTVAISYNIKYQLDNIFLSKIKERYRSEEKGFTWFLETELDSFTAPAYNMESQRNTRRPSAKLYQFGWFAVITCCKLANGCKISGPNLEENFLKRQNSSKLWWVLFAINFYQSTRNFCTDPLNRYWIHCFVVLSTGFLVK